jgi:hypothetical protein
VVHQVVAVDFWVDPRVVLRVDLQADLQVHLKQLEQQELDYLLVLT